MSDEASSRPPWMPSEIPDDSGPPQWDQEEGDALVGQLLLAGVTHLAADGKTVTSKVQCWGRIVSAVPTGIAFVCEGKVWTGETINLPPDLRAFQAARPGKYTLRSTGETVEDPDLTTSWSITDRSAS